MKVAPYLLLTLFAIQGAYLIRSTSPTTDEVAFHMVNGYTYLKTHDYRMSPANPALTREWMALPWLIQKPVLDLNKLSWEEADSVPFAQEFFYKDNRAIADNLLYSSRAMILLVGLAFGWVIYSWSSALYGQTGGLVSLALYTFCPSFVAHSSIAHTDIAVSFFITTAGFALWRYLVLNRRSDQYTFFFIYGLAAAAKYHALYFGPIFLAILIWKKGMRTGAVFFLKMALIGFAAIWVSYFFDLKPMLSRGVPRIDEKLAMLQHPFLQHIAQTWAIPAPSYFLGIAGILRSHQSPYLHYAFGEWGTKPHWYFYLFSFAVKMTIPFLVLLGLRGVTAAFNKNDQDISSKILLAPTFAWFAATAFDSTGVGVRYLFPVIGFLMVWVGGLVMTFTQKKWRVAVYALVLLNAVSALRVFPQYLSYFNESVGGLNGGYHFVRGSDVDWGQGLKDLKKYTEDHKTGKIALRYFGTADPSFYGIDHEPISEEELIHPAGRLYAISLFHLEHAQWAHTLQPTALVGGSIAIYDLRHQNV